MTTYDPDRMADDLSSPAQLANLDHLAPPDPEDVPTPPTETPAESAQGAPAIPALPEEYQLFNQALPGAEASIAVNTVPEGARLRFLKRLVQRALRIVTGRQVDYNAHAYWALRVLAQDAVHLNRTLHAEIHALRRENRRILEAQGSYVAELAERMVAETQRAVREGNEDLLKRVREDFGMSGEELLTRVRDDVNKSNADLLKRVQSDVRAVRDEMTTKAQKAVAEAQTDLVAKAQDAVRRAQENLIEQVRGSVERAEQSLTETARGNVRDAETRLLEKAREVIGGAETRVAKALDTHREDTRGQIRKMFATFQSEIERLTPRPGAAGEAPAVQSAPEVAPAVSSLDEDMAYCFFEENWRGSAEEIRKRQDEYVAYLRPHLQALPEARRICLDAGCGRGEFLEALREAGLSGRGVEINGVFADMARRKGLNVAHEDALANLEATPVASLGAIVSFQVVEHLPPAVLKRFLALSLKRLAPGGVFLAETLNPETFAAYRWFFMDLTHQKFLAPDLMRFLGESAGFEHLETRRIHPVAEHLRLAAPEDALLRANAERLNETLFGPQDYSILLRKPLEE